MNGSRPRRDPGPVPARWLRCPRKSKLIADKFIAFKTPLSSDFDDKVPPEFRFNPKMIFDTAKRDKVKFGLWIDLTNTTRFYNHKIIKEFDCKYVKLQCKGHGETPSTDQAREFIRVVHDFITNHPLERIAVHCTHGFNRTGFLIVSYLVEKMDYSVVVALQMFAEARPIGIYKKEYISELYRRYDDEEDAYPPPPLPDWCFEGEDSYGSDDLNDYDDPSEEGASTSNHTEKSSHKKKRRHNVKNPKFMEGVPGVDSFEEQPKSSYLQKKVITMCGWRHTTFPGSQPVSMDMNNLELLGQKSYRVSWKADGTRYLMLIDGKDEVYLFDRNHSVFKVNGLQFVHRTNIKRYIRNTLLDGEMVIDKVNGKNIPRYLAYDIIEYEEQKVGKELDHPERLQCIENEVIKPRYLAMEKGLIRKETEPFSVRKKDFWPITQAASLLGEKFAKTLSHEPDGLIFQPAKEPYTAGPCNDVLKWKPLSLNSVDFRLKIVVTSGMGLLPVKKASLFVNKGKQEICLAEMKYTKQLKDYNGKIVECKYENNQWVFMRERTDKNFPNSYDTAIAVGDSIKNPVTKEILLFYINEHRFNDDSDIMPPPSKKIKR
ncbi:unnamed protein product [Phyllotreta striolata]|uniref:mRNA-capping enzyme n=1 Tax=Phyllotreta striolata TaxID=444603 RepID=A0A9N9XN84_PHYSR|nr:unnamed protein product [Phyllotreta striolata]